MLMNIQKYILRLTVSEWTFDKRKLYEICETEMVSASIILLHMETSY